MGVREEIERLIGCHIRAYNRILAICYQCEHWQRFTCYYQGHRKAEELRHEHRRIWNDLYKVLSILDEHLGECVGEIVCKEGQLNLEAFGKPFATLMKTSRVGDHISIYVRRKP